jgi:4,5-dihydroxyphthalate decarboxylase
MSDLRISMAFELYDRTMPFVDGSVKPVGTEPQMLAIYEGTRHPRMLDHLEFDVCELSISYYLRAKSQGLPITAIPVFPRRLFGHSRLYVNTKSGIRSPRDLAGKRVGLPSFQNTSAVLIRGDLKDDYGVAVENIVWVPRYQGAVAFEAPPGTKIEPLAGGKNLAEELASGGIDALIALQAPPAFTKGTGEVTRLFPDTRFPIHHLVAVREELLQREPWLALNLVDAFTEAKRMSAHYYDEACFTSLVWGRLSLEAEADFFGGADPWPYGLAANRKNIERFLQLEYDQGLISKPMKVEDIFFHSTLKT